MRSAERTVIWDMYYGKRFLSVDIFIKFCKEVGLYGVERSELEEYEREGWLYRATGTVADTPSDTASPLYHYWQVYELYQVRRQYKEKYQDYIPELPQSLEFGDIWKLAPFLDALSYFQHLYRNRVRQVTGANTPNDDGVVVFDPQQQHDIEQSAREYASQTLTMYRLNEAGLFSSLRGMLYLHSRYEQSERYKLAETLKSDIWRMVEFISYAFSLPTEDISHRIGYVGAGISNQNSLEFLFPNRRKITREKARKILASLAEEYNKATQLYSFSPQDTEELLDFVEKTDLAVFEYALVELNETYFNRTSWFAAESFLRLKSLASFPESLMRKLIQHSGDKTLQVELSKPGVGMGKINKLLFKDSYPLMCHIFEEEYEKNGYTTATSVSEFQENLKYLLTVPSPSEDAFFGINLSLATLLRNFTSHHLVEQADLLSGQYVHCVRSILNTAFFTWRDAKSRRWV